MKIRIAVAIIIILGLFFLLLWKATATLVFIRNLSSTPVSEFSAETNDRTILEGNADIKIPSSAIDIHGFTDGFRDIDTYIRFTIPSNDLKTFLASTVCSEPLSKQDIRDQIKGYPVFEWWHPETTTDYMSCSGSEEHIGQTIFVDMTNSDTYVIYIAAATH